MVCSLAEPMVESWPFSVSFRECNGHRIVTVSSETRLNLIVTPAAFRSVGDLYSFAKLVTHLPDATRRSLSSFFVRSMGKALMASRQKMTTLYRQDCRLVGRKEISGLGCAREDMERDSKVNPQISKAIQQ